MRTDIWLLAVALLCGCDNEGEKPDGEPQVDANDIDADNDGVRAELDCDDQNAAVAPGREEICDDLDNDCDGLVDDEDDAVSGTGTWYADADADGFGDPDAPQEACTLPAGHTAEAGDCDDSSAAANPEGTEVCDGLDNDCDGLTDDEDDDTPLTTWYQDDDRDGYGQDEGTVMSCASPDGYTASGGDCDDTNERYYPGADESDCTDPNDYNCDGVTGYEDQDGDSWPACEECDDQDSTVNPDAAERCNGIDDDCDGDIDLDDSDIVDAWQVYPDNDEDGYGDNGSAGELTCSDRSGYVEDNTDCDDTSALIRPEAVFDFGDSKDNDCDGATDEDVGSERYTHDADIQSIWDASCGSSCHLGSSTSGTLNLSSGYDTTVLVASDDISTMSLITPGDLDNSYLWLKMNNTHTAAGGAGRVMPTSGSLSSSTLSVVETWILEGAVE